MTFARWRTRVPVVLLGLIALALGPAVASTKTASAATHVDHVLLISVDGLHQTDLDWYVHQHPNSALASLVSHGAEYTGAQTPNPSDSFPGMVGQVTGGNPSSTGIYYDDSYNHALLPPNTTNCSGVTPGTEVTYFEALDKDPLSIDAGQGLTGLPWSILKMTSNPTTLIDPTQLPVDPTTCKPVYPHQYLRVNTIFEVARAAGLGTAWSDKHPAYEILNGPSGTGVQDLFTPEINSNASVSGQDYTKDNGLTQVYDSFKVQAVLNWIHGYDHTGTTKVGEPAIFGMNFQTVSTAEKLPSGGYMADGTTPSPLLAGALDYINNQVGMMMSQVDLNNTVIILSAKHGQSPDDPAKLTRISDGHIVDDLNAAWTAAGNKGTLVAFAVNDDAWLMWLNDRSQTATDFAKKFLLAYNGTGDGKDGKAKSTDIQGKPKAYTQAGLATIYAGVDAANYFNIPAGDTVGMQRVPDVVGVAQVGTVYTGGTGKIAEHGGANPQDRDVPIVVSGGKVPAGVYSGQVETTQIAPTILALLGLNPGSLQAVQQEHTAVLPNLGLSSAVSATPAVTAGTHGATASFTVSFSSRNAGQGMVYFGPGPKCGGLLGVATQDQGAGTTNHTLIVRGNELGTDTMPVLPGQTYSFEVVTVSKSGTETDNNNGSCYTVTVPRM